MSYNDSSAILTVQNTNATRFEDMVSSLLERGYTVQSSGFTGNMWWAVLLDYDTIKKLQEDFYED